MRVLGADVAAGRWLGVVVDDGAPACGDGGVGTDGGAFGVSTAGGAFDVTAVTAGGVADLVAAARSGGPLHAVGLDIPIGLPTAGRRQAEALARARLGARASCVFGVPVRSALAAPTHAEADALNRQLAGQGISRQSYALARMIADVDAWVASPAARGLPVVEVHPEVSFAALAGAPLAQRKKSWAGAVRRRALLAAAGITVPADLGPAGDAAAVDDVLDAAAVAWSALRRAHGLAVSLPDPPQDVGGGRTAAIWV